MVYYASEVIAIKCMMMMMYGNNNIGTIYYLVPHCEYLNFIYKSSIYLIEFKSNTVLSFFSICINGTAILCIYLYNSCKHTNIGVCIYTSI